VSQKVFIIPGLMASTFRALILSVFEADHLNAVNFF